MNKKVISFSVYINLGELQNCPAFLMHKQALEKRSESVPVLHCKSGTIRHSNLNLSLDLLKRKAKHERYIF